LGQLRDGRRVGVRLALKLKHVRVQAGRSGPVLTRGFAGRADRGVEDGVHDRLDVLDVLGRPGLVDGVDNVFLASHVEPISGGAGVVHVVLDVLPLDGHVQAVRVDLAARPLLVADDVRDGDLVGVRQGGGAAPVGLELLGGPGVPGRAGVFGLDADRVHVPGHARVGAGTGVPGTPGGDDVPRAIPAKAEVAQRTRKVRAAVGHDALRRVVALRAGRSRRVVPDDAPGGVHAAVAP